MRILDNDSLIMYDGAEAIERCRRCPAHFYKDGQEFCKLHKGNEPINYNTWYCDDSFRVRG